MSPDQKESDLCFDVSVAPRPPCAPSSSFLLSPPVVGSDNADDPDSPSESSASAGAAAGELAEVSFSGDVGESITATWNSEVETPEETTVTTLVKGDGEAVADGDTVSTYLWVGNGTAQKQVYSDYDNGAPESIPNDPISSAPCSAQLSTDETYGSRVAAVTSASRGVRRVRRGEPAGCRRRPTAW